MRLSETRRDQADEIIEYVLTLSESVDVVLGGSEIDQVYLHNYYGDILPSSVTNPCNDTRNDYSHYDARRRGWDGRTCCRDTSDGR